MIHKISETYIHLLQVHVDYNKFESIWKILNNACYTLMEFVRETSDINEHFSMWIYVKLVVPLWEIVFDQEYDRFSFEMYIDSNKTTAIDAYKSTDLELLEEYIRICKDILFQGIDLTFHEPNILSASDTLVNFTIEQN